ncbi:MAG: hypothetical protein ACTSP4_03700 [Candidatus Hodarchaeales archaeon]
MNSGNDKEPSETTKDNDYEILITIPCFICDILDRCGVGQEHSPIECVNLNHWLKEKLDQID